LGIADDRRPTDVVPVGITPAGKWVLVEDDPDRWSIIDGHTPSASSNRLDPADSA